MAEADRGKWNTRYRLGEHASERPSSILVSLAPWLPKCGSALDVAGGAGRNAIWLAERGLDVTLADISDVGLALASQRAERAQVGLTTSHIDLEEEPLPSGPWQLIVSVQFLYRPLLRQVEHELAPGGTLVVIQPTESNLQRNPKPPRQFLLGDGELPDLIGSLTPAKYEEGWSAEDRHDAVLVARRTVE